MPFLHLVLVYLQDVLVSDNCLSMLPLAHGLTWVYHTKGFKGR
jgi:hypothetical protein